MTQTLLLAGRSPNGSERFGPTWGSSLKEAVTYESGLFVKSLGTVTTTPLFPDRSKR